MAWQFDSVTPIYLQIIMAIRSGVLKGTYPPGSKLPTVRELALQAGVNPNTVQRALTEMERDGLLHAERTTGRYVTTDQAVLENTRHKVSAAAIAAMCDKLRGLGLDDGQIIGQVEQWMKENQENEEKEIDIE